MLLSFSEMLRYQLYECNVDRIGIDKEIQYIRNYIAVQQERKEENCGVFVDIPENVRGFTIAPLVLIAFIENAFKYVSCYEYRENKVVISLCKTGDQFLFRAFNTREMATGRGPMETGGIGIANVRRRLDLQYPGKYDLEIRDDKETYEIILTLKIEQHVVESAYSR
jgi:LytS/YehU family sensor histidine kinase